MGQPPWRDYGPTPLVPCRQHAGCHTGPHAYAGIRRSIQVVCNPMLDRQQAAGQTAWIGLKHSADAALI